MTVQLNDYRLLLKIYVYMAHNNFENVMFYWIYDSISAATETDVTVATLT